MSRVRAVMFDFDGTVMDTNEIIIGSWQHTFKRILGHEVDQSVFVPTFGEPLIDTMPVFFPQVDPHEAIDIYREYQRFIWDKPIYMFPGMRDVILGLKERGIMVAMVTSRIWSSARVGHYQFDIADMFDAVVSAEDTNVHKPDPYPALLCLEKLGIRPDEALMVGDSRFDIECAHNAGIPSVLVDWTICLPPEKRVGASRPDYIIRTAEDLYALAGV